MLGLLFLILFHCHCHNPLQFPQTKLTYRLHLRSSISNYSLNYWHIVFFLLSRLNMLDGFLGPLMIDGSKDRAWNMVEKKAVLRPLRHINCGVLDVVQIRPWGVLACGFAVSTPKKPRNNNSAVHISP